MMELDWVGPEADIGQNCSICNFTIEYLKKIGRAIRAEGVITTVDYGEHGWEFDHIWKAASKDGALWTVEHDGLDGQKSTFSTNDCKTTKSYLFSRIPFGYKILETKWIIVMLQEFLEKGREALEIRKYDKSSMNLYLGQCVCEKLSNAKDDKIWHQLTGGKFPDNCFQCSCGQSWHFYRPRGWARTSKKAFELLTKYNGMITRYMIIDENGIPYVRLQSETGGHYV